MPRFIDTHTHLYLEEFDVDRASMMERAQLAGVCSFYFPAKIGRAHV